MSNPISLSAAYALCAWVDNGASGDPPSGWTVAFKPIIRNKNYALVLQSGGTYALVIQGTKHLSEVFEDLDVESQVAFPWITGAQIAAGTNKAMQAVLALEEIKHLKAVHLETYLMEIPTGANLLVTGHSLGGNLASAFGPWIAGNVPAFGGPATPVSKLPDNLQVITFAAPTAGNTAFASFLDAQSNYQASFNQNDVVPYVWAATGTFNAYAIQSMFTSPGPSPCPPGIWKTIKKRLDVIQERHLVYTQTAATTFSGTIQPESGGDAWKTEAEYQHNTAYDVQYLGDSSKRG